MSSSQASGGRAGLVAGVPASSACYTAWILSSGSAAKCGPQFQTGSLRSPVYARKKELRKTEEVCSAPTGRFQQAGMDWNTRPSHPITKTPSLA